MIKKILKKAAFVLPFILGFTGFYFMDELNFTDSVFNSVQLYLMGYGDSPCNVPVEIARWLAPLATAGGIVLVFRKLKAAVTGRIRYLRGGSIAVYGDDAARDILLPQLGKKGIDGGEEFVKAQRYIFAGSEQANFRLYSRFRENIGSAPVYIRCSSRSACSAGGADIRFFSPEELAARIFWKENFIYPLFSENGGRLTIVFAGFGSLGEELLTWGLQDLIFDPSQHIEYHIFGEGDEFTALHPGLGHIGDTVKFHSESWYEDPELLENADMLIVLQQHEQCTLISEMLSLFKRREIQVFSDGGSYSGFLDGQERIKLFPWKEKAQQLDNILGDRLLERAKAINLRYAHLYSGTEETAENSEKEWAKLDSFTRGSNISAADCHELRLRMLKELGSDPESVTADPELLELLSHLEHIRWCRYHYLNNWSYGIPENGTAKDREKRIHRSLVPYEDLTDAEKEKDRENIRVLLSV